MWSMGVSGGILLRVCVVLTARASWAKLQTVCAALRQTTDLQIVCAASAVLERYGNVSAVLEAQGFTIAERVYSVYEGANLVTSAKETGALFTALTDTYMRLRPDVVMVCADRHEILAAAGAAKYLHIPLAHLQGGETSGSVDNSVRDAVTQLSDYHFVCTERAKFRVVSLTGDFEHVWNFGCGSIDLAREALSDPPVTADELGGAGAPIDLSRPFVVLLQHPVTSEADEAGTQMAVTLEAMTAPTICFWPGEDAGAEAMSKQIRLRPWLHTVRSLPPRRFLKLVTQAACLVGNSSAGIREASYLGVPVVNIGTRQHGRQRGPNVIDVPHEGAAIASAVHRQMAHGPYPSSTLYGSGDAGPQIASAIHALRLREPAEGRSVYLSRV